MLILSSPGVTVVHAEEEPASHVAAPAGPACEDGAGVGYNARRSYTVDISGLVAMQADGSRAVVVPLATGGYGYGEEPPAELRGALGSGATAPTD
jgi:hypothetical protein